MTSKIVMGGLAGMFGVNCVSGLLIIVLLCGCPLSPYNALIWNRQNVSSNAGRIDTGPWFEWWYYKVVLPDTGDAFYFIYGVVNPWDTVGIDPNSHAYVAAGDFAAKHIVTQTYSVEDFLAAYERTDVRIQEQRATDTSIEGRLTDGDGGEVSWEIQIETPWSFNAMGWGMFIPKITNIFWYPAQADARFSGWIDFKGRRYAFENAPGYQDRNWGRSFPEWWAWIVANHFDGYPDTALAAGGGRPVILNATDAIEGLAVGLRHEGKQYVFRPNEGARERFAINFGTWELEAENPAGYRIEIEAAAPCDSFMDLVFLTPQGEHFHDFETLTGDLTLRLYKRGGVLGACWELLDTLHSDFAGIEYGRRDITAADCLSAGQKVLFSNFE
jgi:tocopherol cyclase